MHSFVRATGVRVGGEGGGRRKKTAKHHTTFISKDVSM